MRQIIHPQPFAVYTRDLDITGAIEKSEGKIVTNADSVSTADNDRIMVDKNKQFFIKIQDVVHILSVEDNKIKFKEV